MRSGGCEHSISCDEHGMDCANGGADFGGGGGGGDGDGGSGGGGDGGGGYAGPDGSDEKDDDRGMEGWP